MGTPKEDNKAEKRSVRAKQEGGYALMPSNLGPGPTIRTQVAFIQLTDYIKLEN